MYRPRFDSQARCCIVRWTFLPVLWMHFITVVHLCLWGRPVSSVVVDWAANNWVLCSNPSNWLHVGHWGFCSISATRHGVHLWHRYRHLCILNRITKFDFSHFFCFDNLQAPFFIICIYSIFTTFDSITSHVDRLDICHFFFTPF